MSFHFPENAPFTGAQKMWLRGFLDAFEGQLGASASAPPAAIPAAAAGLPVTIAWGSQTGTAQALAKKFSKNLTSLGHSTTIVDMAELDVPSLSTIDRKSVV